jgi:hypothetical protein
LHASDLPFVRNVLISLGPLGLEGEARRPGSKLGMARWAADGAVDKIRDRFGRDAIEYSSATLGIFVFGA